MKRLLKIGMAAAIFLSPFMSRAGELLVEAESFNEKGGWCVDQQFMDFMGSPYLLAHGLGEPVGDAVTEVVFPETGAYNVYVRTFNWTSPWHDGEGPGKFRLSVGGKRMDALLGCEGDRWLWQYAGKVRVKDKIVELRLSDLTGFDGRCDAIYFTTGENTVPPSGGEELAAFRDRLLDRGETLTQKFDLVVVGGGIAGMCAAVTAARMGCSVALVNDRPVLGGNNSSEIRVHLGGVIELPPYERLGRMIREFGHSKFGNAQPAANYEDNKKSAFVAAEKNITLFANYHVNKVEKSGGRIMAVTAEHIENGGRIRLVAPLFSDCTGDGTVGYLAGADYRIGREGRGEYGESLAPEVADSMTMGASVQWYSSDTGKKENFPEFSYGLVFNEDNCEKVMMGEWTWETGMNRDQIVGFEHVRDYGLMVVYSNWSFLKNHKKDNGEYRNRKLEWVAYVSGKRESRRLLGDYVLKQDDLLKNVFHEDASFTTSWTIDLHYPDPENAKHFPDEPFKASTNHTAFYPYGVPYRCLYSRNVDNLFMAGRDISVTHVALGTVRVMRTTGMMGEVVGMAASLCKKYGELPRGIYQRHLPELKELMRKGAAVDGELPDNQRFNLGSHLEEPPVVTVK